jgi:ArsR family transcriptional regulator
MDEDSAITTLAALAQSTRVAVFRLLVTHEPNGLPAGEVARQISVPHNTMSAHLGVLTRAGLVKAERHSRSITYRANLDRMREVMSFLVADCCGGDPELCAPLIDSLSSCCQPEEKSNRKAKHDA